MAGDDELLPVDDKDIFASATSDKPPAEPEPQVEEPKPEGERPRDEQGRFLPKEPEAEKPESAPQEPLKTEDQRQSPEDAIPSWRLREVAQRARDAEERLAAREAEFRYLLQQQAQVRQQQPPEQPPDIIENPAGYAQYVRQQAQVEIARLQQHFEARAIATSLHRADRAYGEEFRKAYEAFDGQIGNEELLARVKNSFDQGEEILTWYRQREALREIGGDPKAYRQKLKAELLNDPEFRKEYGETLRSQAGNRSPSNIRSLPNLSRAPGSSSNAGDDYPTDDAGIFGSITAGLNRR